MLKGIDMNQRINFISKEDKEEPKTVFVIRPLSAIEMMNTSKDEYLSLMLNKSIVEIKNPDLKDRQEIDDFVNGLNVAVLTELINEITDINKLKDDEIKN